MNNADKPETRGAFKSIAIIVLIVLVGIGFLFLPVGKWVESLRGSVEQLGAWGYIVFALAYAALTVLLVPGSAMTLAAGALFGFAGGMLVIVAGSNLGALAAFALARSVLRQRVESWSKQNPRFDTIARAIAQNGFKIVFLLRLSPVFPFTVLNYVLGLTRVTTGQYILANVLGMLPGTVAFVYMGTLGATLSGSNGEAPSKIKLAAQIVGLIATLAATVVVTRIARRALREVEASPQ